MIKSRITRLAQRILLGVLVGTADETFTKSSQYVEST